MERQEFVRLVAMLVRRGNITAEEGAELIAYYDAQQIDPNAVPLPIADAVEEADQRDIIILLTWVAASAGTASLYQRQRARDRARLEAEQAVDQLARKLSQSGDINAWHQGMKAVVENYTRSQAVIGYGQALDPYLSELTTLYTRQSLQFLYLFAGAAMARQLLGKPYSSPYYAARSRHYLKRGWEMYFRGAEEAIRGEEGWVIDYIAQDDYRTCGPCSTASYNSPYLPGTGPYPGDVCRGGGYCRCERRRRWSPEEAAELRGTSVPAAQFTRT